MNRIGKQSGLALLSVAAMLAVAPAALAKNGGNSGKGAGGAACAQSSVEQFLASTGADADGTARARFRQRDDCRRDFSVELGNVPVGDYDLIVGGVNRGRITVVTTAFGTEGEIEFEAADDGHHALVLDFDPLDATIEIRAGGVAFFADVFHSSVAGTSPTPTGTPRAVETERTRTATPVGTKNDNSGPPTRSRTRTRTKTPDRDRDKTSTPTRTPTA